MARLPAPGNDDGNWGSILNDFLSQSIASDGSLKGSAVTAAGAAPDTTVVHTTGNESVGGIKTFVSSPIVPTPTQPTHAASKSYVDSTTSSGAPDATTTNKGVVQLAGDLGGTAASPTVPGLTGKLSTSTASATYVAKSANLSDLGSAATARTNLGLGTAAVATKGAANGVASLDGTTKVPIAQLPALSSYIDQNPDNLTNVYHATGFGADNTGAADASTALQSAIDAANTQYTSTGRQQTVYLDAGTYKLTASVTPKDGVVLRGAGALATRLLPYGTVCALTTLRTEGSPLTSAGFIDFGIDGTNQTSSYDVSRKGIFVQFHQDVFYRNLDIRNTVATGLGVDHFHGDCVIDKVRVINCGRGNDGTNPGGNGIGLGIGAFSDGYDTVTVTSCYAKTIGRAGIMVERQDNGYRGRGVRIIGNYAYGCQFGIMDAGAEGIVISDNQCYANTSAGIVVNTGTFVANSVAPRPGSRGLITNNVCQKNLGFGILLDYTVHLPEFDSYTVSGNVCIENNNDGIRALTASGNILGIRIKDNACESNGGVGIRVLSTGVGTYYDTEVSGNRVVSNLTSGIYLDAPLTGLSVYANRLIDRKGTPSQTTGIYLASGRTFTNIRIMDNDPTTMATALSQNGTLAGTKIFSSNSSSLDSGIVPPGGSTNQVLAKSSGSDGDVSWVTISGGSVTPSLTNSVLPAISGTTTTGQTLTVSNGTWSATPDSYTYQWNRDGSAISGATSQTYVLVTADQTHNITATVTAVKASYTSGSATSAAIIGQTAANRALSDTFARTSSSSMGVTEDTTHTTWGLVQASAGSGVWATPSADGAKVISGGVCFATLDTLASDFDISAKIVALPGGNGVGGLAANIVNSTTNLVFSLRSTATTGKYTITQRDTSPTEYYASSTTPAVNDIMRLTRVGTLITAYVNGSVLWQGTVAASSSTRHGFYGNFGSGPNLKFGNFVSA